MKSSNYRVLFVTGIVIGAFLAVKFNTKSATTKLPSDPILSSAKHKKGLESAGILQKPVDFSPGSGKHDKSYHLESQYLFDRIPVHCVILVKNKNNAQAANETWARSCNKATFIELRPEKKIMSLKKRMEESPWMLLCDFLKSSQETRYSWTIFVYDYTFVLVENLRMLVSSIDPKGKFYMGHGVKFWNMFYNLGQAGFVLSSGAIVALQNKLEKESCSNGPTYYNKEDYILGRHLSEMNINISDTRDQYGLSTFHPYNLYHAFFPSEGHYKSAVFPHKCCSKHSISFQSIEGDKMYTYNYLLYELKVYYDQHLPNYKPRTLSAHQDDRVWKRFLDSRNIPTNISAEQYYRVWEDLVEDPMSFAYNMRREQLDVNPEYL